MGYKRSEWHSGLTYQQTCQECRTTIKYKDDMLGFRPWFPDGFVYCPRCHKPLRHNEKFAIDGRNRPSEPIMLRNEVRSSMFCSQCGKQLRPEDVFCSQCGTKRQ